MAHVDLYDYTASIYNEFELSGKTETPITNKMLDNVFKHYHVKNVLDMTCGTGAQTIGLSKLGYQVTGSDLSQGMLDVAKERSKSLPIKYTQANMKSISVGHFDAIISMFNAIGHLSKPEFITTLKNAFKHINEGGCIVFDILDLDIMKYAQQDEHIDTLRERNDYKYVRFTSSSLVVPTAVLKIKHKTFVQYKSTKPKQIDDEYNLQLYNAQQLRTILNDVGFSSVTISNKGMLDVFESGVSLFVIAKK